MVGYGHISVGKDEFMIYIFSILLMIIAFIFMGCIIFVYVFLKAVFED